MADNLLFIVVSCAATFPLAWMESLDVSKMILRTPGVRSGASFFDTMGRNSSMHCSTDLLVSCSFNLMPYEGFNLLCASVKTMQRWISKTIGSSYPILELSFNA